MELLLWLGLGLVAGWLASIVMGTNANQGPIMDIVLGVVGAFVGGFVFNLFGQPGATGFNIYSIIVASLGAIALIWVGRLLSARV
jgi:uncharacterized membrane protein YeaQ/YmgE (transglycosylase-associated protein family)